MKLEKSEALTIYSVLFHYLSTSNHAPSRATIEDVLDRLHHFLSEEESSQHPMDDSQEEDQEYEDSSSEDENEDEEYEDEDDVEEDDEPAELFVDPAAASELPPINVTTPDGSTLSFEFEDIGEDEIVDVLIDEGSVIIEDVFKVLNQPGVIQIHDGEEWHSFKIGKLPKAWKKMFPVGTIVGFHSEEEE